MKTLLVVGVLGVTAAVAWHLATREPLAHALIGTDPSVSVAPNCAGVRDAVKTMLASAPGIREGSTLTLLAMGRDAKNPQPTRAFSGAIPIAVERIMGRDDEGFRATEGAFYADVEQACASAGAGSRSPIYELVKQGIAHLRSLDCGPDGRCQYLIKTDLDEDVEPALRDAIARSIKDASASAPSELARSLDNAGMEVTVCGLAEVQPRRSPPSSTEARIRIWSALFTDPGLVSFQPYCGH